jgi:gluconolactonase
MSRTSLGFLIAVVILSVAQPISAQQKTDAANDPNQSAGAIEQLDPALADLLDVDANIEVLSIGHQWVEGPVWIKSKDCLLFSDVPRNKIHQWTQKGGTKVFMDPSGFDGESHEKEPGTNGLFLDRDGRLLACDHGNRRIYRLEDDGTKTTLADRFEGKRFNSPNDLVMNSRGDIFFTDPPYGLKDESKRELDYFGVYHLAADGTVSLVTKALERPNGIGLSPDEKTLYVAQSHRPAPIYQAYDIADDGTIDENGRLLFDASEFAAKGDPGMPDGMTIDVHGNLWATGPGGVLIISPEGKLLGRILLGKSTANCCFGEDGSTLFITSSDRVCRVKTKTQGLGW